MFLDARGGDRALSVSWHPEADLVVLSLWRGRLCVGTFRMPVEDVPTLIGTLREVLHDGYETARRSVAGGKPAGGGTKAS